ncbi:transposase [Pseudomonas sp.]|uniref:transposase n=1 Tax=Pseudomonas sp. TaxID=306 RepID=UPI003BB49A64
MPRLPRYGLPGVPPRIIQRGNNRQAIFSCEDDYSVYLDWLKRAAEQYDLAIHAYVLMTNHVHLLATPGAEDSIAKALQSLGRRYVQYFNHRYGHMGTLWESRYRATVIDSESYLLACIRYIELNPVRAAMVTEPGEYPWSSYRCNAMGQEDELVTRSMG